MDSLLLSMLRILSRTLTRITPKVVKTKTCQIALTTQFYLQGSAKTQIFQRLSVLYFNHQHPLIWKCAERNFQSSSVKWGDENVVACSGFPDSITKGIVKWDKAVGDTVNADDIVCEIETEKIAIPVASPVTGIIKERFVSEGGTVRVGDKLFKITKTSGKRTS